MKITHGPCRTDDDYALASLFFLEHRRDVHRGYDTLNSIDILYDSMMNGHVLKSTDESGEIIGLTIYHLISADEGGERDTVFIDIAVSDRQSRGSRLFVTGLSYLLDLIEEEHPEAKRVELTAYTDNPYLCRLYAKFAEPVGAKEDALGELTVFRTTVNELRERLAPYGRQ